MLGRLTARMVRTARGKALAKFVIDFGLAGAIAVARHRWRGKRGFPPFLFLSLTSRCNLRCQGCWVSVDGPAVDLPFAQADRAIRSACRRGTRFFGLLGGEPLLYPHLLDLLERHRRCYFQLFTNGTDMTPELAGRLAELGNVTPLVSIEGTETVSDVRRGGCEVYRRTLEGLSACLSAGLVTGVATSACKSNLDDLASEAFLDRLIELGAHYVWYYAYRPAGPDPHPELALDAAQLLQLRRFIVEMRARKPIVIVDTYYDACGAAFCPAVDGLSYHVSPAGAIEPCPPIQFARDCLGEGADPVAAIEHSAFLPAFREFAASRTSGCVLLEDPAALAAFLRQWQARDTTGRGTGYAELGARIPQPSHHQPGLEVPEKHWAYKLAKRLAFFGFSGYG